MMAVDACNILDASVDFSEYDRDGDGIIDNVFIFYAGLGEATGGGEDTVWPHSADVIGNYVYDGKTLKTYGCTNEWVMDGATSGHPDGVGTFCHEFAHVLGLPDLYATTYPTPAPFTPGAWSLLDIGPYNNGGRTPPAMELFSRYALGWWDPIVLDSPLDGRLLPLSQGGSGYLVATGNPDEYFLIENRQKSGWDRFIPGHGMLVWHVQYDPAVWMAHTVNNDTRHQYVDILEADGIPTESTRSGDAFPGDAGVASITGLTTPGFVTSSGQAVDMAITDISEAPDGIVTFKAQGGAEPAAPVAVLDAADVTPRSFTARWQGVDGAVDYRLSVFADGSPVNGYDGRLTGIVDSYTVAGLEPSTRYTYTVSVVMSDRSGMPSRDVEVLTPAATFAFELPQALDATNIKDNSFTANWLPMSEASSYLLTVESRHISGASEAVEAFDGKKAAWNTNSSTFYAAESYVGEAAPSLKVVPGGFVASPMVERGTLRSFSFWHRARNAASAWVAVDVYACGCWRTVAELPLETAKGGAVLSVHDFPDDAVCVRMVLHDPTGEASAYVDDFRMEHGGSVSRSVVAAFDACNVGDVSSVKVGSLDSGTEYFYTVEGLDASGTLSLPSAAMRVLTSGASGIACVSADTTADAVSVPGGVRTSAAAVVYAPDGRMVARCTSAATIDLSPGLYVVCMHGFAKKIVVK